MNRHSKAYAMTGKVYGKLTVGRRIGTNDFGAALWDCECECGQSRAATTAQLRSGEVSHCGCAKLSPKALGDTENEFPRTKLMRTEMQDVDNADGPVMVNEYEPLCEWNRKSMSEAITRCRDIMAEGCA